MSQVLLIPGLGRMTFAGALRLLQPYSPRLAANFMDPAGSLYTDASRTTQVTTLGNRIRSFTNFVTGQPHGAASSDAKSPLWNEFSVNGRTVRGAMFDGSDDCLQVSGFDLSDTDKVCVIAGVRALVGTPRGMIVEHTANTSMNSGGFQMNAPSGVVDTLLFGSAATSGLLITVSPAFSPPQSMFLAGCSDIANDVLKLFVNNSPTTSTSDQGSGTYANSTLNIGGRNNAASLPFNGAVSYLFILGAIPPDAVLTRVYRGLAPQIGVSV